LLIGEGWNLVGDTLICNINEADIAEFSLFPNPSKGIVNLTLKSTDSDLPFYLYNQIGQLIKKLHLNEGENKIDLKNYANGLYHFTNGRLGEKLLLVK